MKLKKTIYICIEGTEGVGKGLQTQMLVDHLKSQGYSVLHTKEPGTPHLPLTVELRGIMLNNKYEKQENVHLLIQDLEQLLSNPKNNNEMTKTAREFIEDSLASIKEEQKMSLKGRELVSQAIRSIHLEKLIKTSMGHVDFIIQDRGILSGMAYGEACGNNIADLREFAQTVTEEAGVRSRNFIERFAISADFMKEYSDIYDHVIYLEGDSSFGLKTAGNAKQEFADGDAMELKGNNFMAQVANNFAALREEFNSVHVIKVHEIKTEDHIQDSGISEKKSISFRNKDTIFSEILKAIGVK